MSSVDLSPESRQWRTVGRESLPHLPTRNSENESPENMVLVLRVFGRLTDAGCKIDDLSESANDGDLTTIPEGGTPDMIVDLFFGLTQPPRSAHY